MNDYMTFYLQQYLTQYLRHGTYSINSCLSDYACKKEN